MRRIGFILFFFVCIVMFSTPQSNAHASDIQINDIDLKDEMEEEQKSMEESILEKSGVEDIQNFLNEADLDTDISFMDLVWSILKEKDGLSMEKIGAWIKNALCHEFMENKALLVQILLIGIAFGILNNFTDIFENAYISELAFVFVYGILVVLLMKSFLIMHTLTKDTLNVTVQFMQTLVPVYCMSMAFSNGTSTAAGFYELTFLIIYMVQWVILYVLIPLVQIMVVFEFMNHLLKGERFSKMTELLEDGIRFALKLITSVVIGLNVIQGLIQPAADKLKGSIFTKTAGAIPGIGNSINAVGEVIVGTGTLVKNSVGVAAMIVLFVLCFLPLLKMTVMAFFYKLSAAAVEPVADKRIAGTINGVCRGSVLLAKILLTSMLLFLLTIAMITASSSFIY